MHPLSHYDLVLITLIDFIDRTYFLGPYLQEPPDDELVSSIRQFGLLHPPILKQKDDGFLIVTGRNRLLAKQLAGSDKKIMCIIIPEEVKEEFAYELIVEATLYNHHLSLIEQATLLNNFLRLRPVEDALPLLAKLGHKPQKHLLDAIVSLLTLPAATQAAVHAEIIPLKTARRLQKLSHQDQESLVHLITSLHLGGSKQQKLIEYGTELTMRANVPLNKLLHVFLASADQTKHENIPQKAAALLKWLHRQCFPRTTQAEEEFRKIVAGLRLPDHLQLEHSPSFEEDRVKLSVNLPDLQTVNKLLPEIVKITSGTGNDH